MDQQVLNSPQPLAFWKTFKFKVIAGVSVLMAVVALIIIISIAKSTPTSPHQISSRRPDRNGKDRGTSDRDDLINLPDERSSGPDIINEEERGGRHVPPNTKKTDKPFFKGLAPKAVEIFKKKSHEITKNDIDYMAKLKTELPNTDEAKVQKKAIDDFLAANQSQLGDVDIKEKFTKILKKGKNASPDDVKFIKDKKDRAVELKIATGKEIKTFLDLQSAQSTTVDVALISSILRKKSFFDVTEDDVDLVNKAKNDKDLKDRAKAIDEFLNLHTPKNRELAFKLKNILDKNQGKKPSELSPADLNLLKDNAINNFGLNISAFISTRTRAPRTLEAGQKPPTPPEIVEELNQIFRDFRLADAKKLADKARDLFDEAVEAIKANHLEKSFPLLMAFDSFDAFALDLLLAEFDSVMTPTIDLSAGGKNVDLLRTLLAAIQEVLIRGHPRFDEFNQKTLEDIKKDCKPISSLEDYNSRAVPVIQGLIKVLEKPPLSEKIVGFRLPLIVRLRSELETAIPGQADTSPLKLGSAVRDGDVIMAVAKNVKSAVTCYFTDVFHELLDATTFDEISCTQLLQWFHLVAIEWTRESCGNVLFDALDPTRISTVKTYAAKRARDAIINKVKSLESSDEIAQIAQSWKSTVSRFGYLSSAENYFQINDIVDVDSCKKVIARIVRSELYDSILAKEDSAIVEAKFKVFQRVYKLLKKKSKLMKDCTNAEEAKEAYNKSEKNPEVHAGNLKTQILEEAYKDRSVVDKSGLGPFRKLVSKLRQVLNSNPTIWSQEERAVWFELRSVKDVGRYLFCERMDSPIKGKGYREYRMKVALYEQKFKEYDRCNTDQAAIDKLYNELKALKEGLEELQKQMEDQFPDYYHPLSDIPNAPKKAQTSKDDPFKNWKNDVTGIYTFWNGIPDTENYAASEDLFNFQSDIFKQAVENWKDEENILYAMPSEDKNVIAFLFNTIPFDGSFSPYPANGNADISLVPDSTIMVPPAAFSYLIDVDIHLQALEGDPVHLMFWAIRAQQAMFNTNGIGKDLINELMLAYRTVKKQVADFPDKNFFHLVLHELLTTPVTHDILQDMRSTKPTKPKVHDLFDCGVCTDKDSIPGPNPGMLVYLYFKIMDCVDQRYGDTWSLQEELEGKDIDKEAWKRFWRLQILGAFDSEAMLPTMRQWIHDNKSWFCKDRDIWTRIIGYTRQNRSAFLYDEVMIICKIEESFLDNDMYSRPVGSVEFFVDSNSLFSSGYVQQELRLPQVDLTDVTAFENPADDPKAIDCKVRFERARKAMQPLIGALHNQWEIFARRYPRIKFVNSINVDVVGIDAGGLSRDAINYSWLYLLNAKFSGLFTDFNRLMPNLNSDPTIGRVLGSLIVWGFQRELMPFRYFHEDIHKLIFRETPVSIDEIFKKYVKIFLKQDSDILIDGRADLINKVDSLASAKKNDIVTIDAFEENYFRSPLPWRPLSLKLQVQQFMCGQQVDDHLRESYGWTQDAPEYYTKRYIELFKLEAVTRFQMFSMNFLEALSRSMPNSNLSLLRPRTFDDDRIFDKLSVDDYKAEDVVKGLVIDDSCQNSRAWWPAYTTDPATNQTIEVDCNPKSILLKDKRTRRPIKDVFVNWLTKTWAPTLKAPPATSSDEEKQKYKEQCRLSRRNLERFLTIVTGSASKPVPGKHTIKLTCYNNIPAGGDYKFVSPQPHSCFNTLDLMPIPDEEFFEEMMEMFVNDVKATRYGTG